MLFWAFLLKRYRAWKLYRATYEELSNLDDRTLADISVGRSEIARVAHQAAMKAVAA